MRQPTKDTSRDQGREVLTQLPECELIVLWNRLLLFTKRYYGVDREDLVGEAFLSALQGRRSWNLRKTPFRNLCWIIRSITSNHLLQAKRFVPLEESDHSSLPGLVAEATLQDQSLVDACERCVIDESFHSRLRNLLHDDPLVHRIVDYLIETPLWKPMQIARELGVTPGEIYQAGRRLKRKLKNLKLKNLKPEEGEAL